MPEISKIQLQGTNGHAETYNIKDEYARSQLNQKLNSPEILLGLTFKSGNNQTIDETDIIISQDGANYSNIRVDIPMGRDPSIIFNKNKNLFFATCTPATQTNYTFVIYTSSDLKNWTPHNIIVPNYLQNIKMAPDLFLIDENNLLVSFSYQTGTEEDITGTNINKFDIVLCNLNITNINNITVSNVRVANLINCPHKNNIDSNIILYNNTYYLAVKNDYYKTIQIYTSTDLNNFTLLNQNILNSNDVSDNSIFLEGPCMYIFNNKVYLICDSYANLHNLIVAKTTNFTDFEFRETNLYYFNHATVISLNEEIAKKIVYNLNNYNISTNNRLTPYNQFQTGLYIRRGDNKEICAIPNSIYFIVGSATIKNIKNPFNCKSQKFCFITNPSEKLTIQKVLDNDYNKVFINTKYNNEKIFEISLNKNSLIFAPSNFEELTGESALSNISYNETYLKNVSILLYRSGNTVTIRLQAQLNQTLSSNKWVSPIITMLNNYYLPICNMQCNSNINTDLQYNITGTLNGMLKGNENDQINITVTFVTN